MHLRLLLAVLCLPSMVSADWPQFQGPTRNGISQESDLLTEWPDGGPALLWTYRESGLVIPARPSSASGYTSPGRSR